MKQQKAISELDASDIQPVCPVALYKWERHVASMKAVIAANQDANQWVKIEWEGSEWSMRCEYIHTCSELQAPSTGSRIIHTIRHAGFPANTKASALLEAAAQMRQECRIEAMICVKAIAAAHAATA